MCVPHPDLVGIAQHREQAEVGRRGYALLLATVQPSAEQTLAVDAREGAEIGKAARGYQCVACQVVELFAQFLGKRGRSGFIFVSSQICL